MSHVVARNVNILKQNSPVSSETDRIDETGLHFGPRVHTRLQMRPLLLSMIALPIKMVLRWLFNLKYIVALPEIFFNI